MLLPFLFLFLLLGVGFGLLGLSGLLLSFLLRLHHLLVKLLFGLGRVGKPRHQALFGSIDFTLQIGSSSNFRIIFFEQNVVSLYYTWITSRTCLDSNSYTAFSIFRICRAVDSVIGGTPRLFWLMTFEKYWLKKEESFADLSPVVCL